LPEKDYAPLDRGLQPGITLVRDGRNRSCRRWNFALLNNALFVKKQQHRHAILVEAELQLADALRLVSMRLSDPHH
jgi:hypothetical protein